MLSQGALVLSPARTLLDGLLDELVAQQLVVHGVPPRPRLRGPPLLALLALPLPLLVARLQPRRLLVHQPVAAAWNNGCMTCSTASGGPCAGWRGACHGSHTGPYNSRACSASTQTIPFVGCASCHASWENPIHDQQASSAARCRRWQTRLRRRTCGREAGARPPPRHARRRLAPAAALPSPRAPPRAPPPPRPPCCAPPRARRRPSS